MGKRRNHRNGYAPVPAGARRGTSRDEGQWEALNHVHDTALITGAVSPTEDDQPAGIRHLQRMPRPWLWPAGGYQRPLRRAWGGAR